MTTSPPQGLPNWAECATTDLDKAEAFYASVFGWTSQRSQGDDGSVYSLQFLDGVRVAGMFELTKEIMAQGVPPHWGTYIEVGDVDAAVASVVDAGGTVVDGPHSDGMVGSYCVIQDPVGAYLRLWHSNPGMQAGVFNVPGAMIWNELATKDPEKAAEFYKRVLGLGVEVAPGTPPYTMLQIGDRPVAGILEMPPQMGDMPSGWDVYFASDDVDTTTEAARAAGGKILRAPFDVAGGAARIAVIADPQGAVFEVMKMNEAV